MIFNRLRFNSPEFGGIRIKSILPLMAKKQKKIITVQGAKIQILSQKETDYISLTDITQNFEDGSVLIEKWFRNKNTIDFLGVWEKLNNQDFIFSEYETISNKAGLNRFTLSVKKMD